MELRVNPMIVLGLLRAIQKGLEHGKIYPRGCDHQPADAPPLIRPSGLGLSSSPYLECGMLSPAKEIYFEASH